MRNVFAEKLIREAMNSGWQIGGYDAKTFAVKEFGTKHEVTNYGSYYLGDGMLVLLVVAVSSLAEFTYVTVAIGEYSVYSDKFSQSQNILLGLKDTDSLNAIFDELEDCYGDFESDNVYALIG